MGLMLVQCASAQFAQLPGNQFKVLIRMCLTALDKPNGKGQPARLYYAGWEPLSEALGRDVPPNEPEHLRRRRRLSNEVTDLCKRLCEAQAIERLTDHPQATRRQEYRLLLDTQAPQIVVPDADSGTTIDGASGTTIDGDTRHHDSWSTGTTNRGALGSTQEGLGGGSQDSSHLQGAQPQVVGGPVGDDWTWNDEENKLAAARVRECSDCRAPFRRDHAPVDGLCGPCRRAVQAAAS